MQIIPIDDFPRKSTKERSVRISISIVSGIGCERFLVVVRKVARHVVRHLTSSQSLADWPFLPKLAPCGRD